MTDVGLTPPRAEAREDRAHVDPVLLGVMANRLKGIVREMSNTLLRTARSSVLSLCRDFSTAVCAADGQLLESAEGLPIQVLTSGELCRSMTELHADIAEGDAYLHNDPYMGGTHHADHSILIPVFWEGEHIFTAWVNGHLADCGNSLPSTYMPTAKDVYEEGAISFPCVRAQRGYRDIDDIVRMCRRRIRAPEVWYGDYLALCGAARVGERALKEYISRYGIDAVKQFIVEWLDYSERRMIDAIRRLPGGEWHGEATLDAFPGMPPEGLQLGVTIGCEAEQGKIRVDLRDNPDCGPHGLNLSKTTSENSARIGIFNCLDPTIPHNAGSLRRIEILLRENCIVGIPVHPTSCSMATSTLTERVVGMITRAVAEAIPDHGLAEGATSFAPYWGVISGQDRPSGDFYITHLFVGTAGGPAAADVDGWISYNNAIAAGAVYRDSVEVLEQNYPIVVHESRIWKDSEGAGRFRGAPGNITSYGPRFDPMTVQFSLDGWKTPPRGVRGGGDALGPGAYVVRREGTVDEHGDIVGFVEIEPGERMGSRSAGGGGYGNPLERDPSAVLEDVREGFVSRERAAAMYGVVIDLDPTNPDALRIDERATRAARSPGAGSAAATGGLPDPQASSPPRQSSM
jgi:N-methylhydantoinase B